MYFAIFSKACTLSQGLARRYFNPRIGGTARTVVGIDIRRGIVAISTTRTTIRTVVPVTTQYQLKERKGEGRVHAYQY